MATHKCRAIPVVLTDPQRMMLRRLSVYLLVAHAKAERRPWLHVYHHPTSYRLLDLGEISAREEEGLHLVDEVRTALTFLEGDVEFLRQHTKQIDRAWGCHRMDHRMSELLHTQLHLQPRKDLARMLRSQQGLASAVLRPPYHRAADTTQLRTLRENRATTCRAICIAVRQNQESYHQAQPVIALVMCGEQTVVFILRFATCPRSLPMARSYRLLWIRHD